MLLQLAVETATTGSDLFSYIQLIIVPLVIVMLPIMYQGLRKNNSSTEEIARSVRPNGTGHKSLTAMVEDVLTEVATLKGDHGATRDTLSRLEKRISEMSATQNVGIVMDDRPMFKTTPHGALIWCNEAAETLLGMSVAELTNDGWARAVYQEDAERVFTAWKKSVDEVVSYGPISYRYIHPVDKHLTWVKAIADPIVTEGEVIGWFATVVVLDQDLPGL
jgi:PAS domain-containing protein